MTRRLSDPLDLLRQLSTPEPDPARKVMTIAAARARFEDVADRPLRPLAQRRMWLRWLAGGAVALAAMAAVVVVLPRSEAPQLAGRGSTSAPPGKAAVPPGHLVEAPLAPGPETAAPSRTMGARPPQAGSPISADPPASTVHYDFDGFQIAVREEAHGFALSLEREGIETPFDSRHLDPGISFELLDAVLLTPPDGPELLLLQSRAGDATNWDVFTIGPDGIRLSGQLSRRVHDAPDRAAAARRLDAPQ